MKALRSAVLAAWTLAAISLVQGCALLLVGGAAVGAVKYVGNTLQVTHDVSLDRAWDAANAAFAELQIPVTSSAMDGTSGRLEGRNAQEQPVRVDLLRKTDKVTQIRITVGTFDTAANREGGRHLHEAMKARF